MKILTENYEWKYSQIDLRRNKSKRRPQTPSKNTTGKITPPRSTRPVTPSKTTVRGADSKISGKRKFPKAYVCQIFKQF